MCRDNPALGIGHFRTTRNDLNADVVDRSIADVVVIIVAEEDAKSAEEEAVALAVDVRFCR